MSGSTNRGSLPGIRRGGSAPAGLEMPLAPLGISAIGEESGCPAEKDDEFRMRGGSEGAGNNLALDPWRSKPGGMRRSCPSGSVVVARPKGLSIGANGETTLVTSGIEGSSGSRSGLP